MQQVASAHRLDALCMVADPAGRFIATGGNDHQVKLWACSSGSGGGEVLEHQVFIGHPAPVHGESRGGGSPGLRKAGGQGTVYPSHGGLGMAHPCIKVVGSCRAALRDGRWASTAAWMD